MVLGLPIDPDFRRKMPVAGIHAEHSIRGEVMPPSKLGVHGTEVAVDFDICVADGVCLSVCPVNVFEWIETPRHAASIRKSDPVRESDCVFCRACEVQCPVLVIKITEKVKPGLANAR